MSHIISGNYNIFPYTEFLLPYVDILITDYSGMYSDFQLLNRPMIFIPYDLEEYSTYTGVTVNYDKFTAGPCVSSQKEFIAALSGYLHDSKKDESLRLKIMDFFHDYQDGKACERIQAELDKLIG